jgi:hypothetical protein
MFFSFFNRTGVPMTTKILSTQKLAALAAAAVIAVSPAAWASEAPVVQLRLADGSLGDQSIVYGEASLVKADELGPNGNEGLILELDTSNLVIGDAYTVWAAIFNNPDACLDGCNGADFGIPEVQGSLIWASGMVVDAEEAVFTAFLELDHPAGEVRPPGTMEGLTSLLAEVHAVVRTHGPASENSDILEAQLTTFEGGCDIFSCYDPQLAILAPIPEPSSTLLAAIGIAGWALMRRRQGNH